MLGFLLKRARTKAKLPGAFTIGGDYLEGDATIGLTKLTGCGKFGSTEKFGVNKQKALLSLLLPKLGTNSNALRSWLSNQDR